MWDSSSTDVSQLMSIGASILLIVGLMKTIWPSRTKSKEIVETPEQKAARERLLYEGMYIQELSEAKALAESQRKGEENPQSPRHPDADATLHEMTPCGEVIMAWDRHAEVFVYRSDARSIPYKVLDTVARKFCLEHKCPEICVDYKAEYEQGRARAITERQADLAKEREARKNEEEQTGPFAKFKPYNRKAIKGSKKGTKGRYRVITAKANRFRCSGKIETNSPKPVRKVEKPISFTDFKKADILAAGTDKSPSDRATAD